MKKKPQNGIAGQRALVLHYKKSKWFLMSRGVSFQFYRKVAV